AAARVTVLASVPSGARSILLHRLCRGPESFLLLLLRVGETQLGVAFLLAGHVRGEAKSFPQRLVLRHAFTRLQGSIKPRVGTIVEPRSFVDPDLQLSVCVRKR